MNISENKTKIPTQLANFKKFIAIMTIICIVIYSCGGTEANTTPSNGLTEIVGTLVYSNIIVKQGSIGDREIVIPELKDWVAGQTVEYEISARPSLANESNVIINSTNGVITVSSNALTIDSGEYMVGARGIEGYGGSITATVFVSIISEIGGSFAYSGIEVLEGNISNVGPEWTDAKTGQTVEYEISGRPIGASESNIIVDSSSGVISVTTNATNSDSGEYTVRAVGSVHYEGSNTARVQIDIKKRISGSLSYSDVSLREGTISNVNANWVNEIAGQMVEYEISARPSLANAGSVSIDPNSGVISIATTATTNDTGDYTIRATGEGQYGGSISSIISINVRKGIVGSLSYTTVAIREGAVGSASPSWMTTGQTVSYGISKRPDRASAGSVSIDPDTGEISVASTVTTNDTGEYSIVATGIGKYIGTITSTIQIDITKKDWIKLTDNAGFPFRNEHKSVVLNNEMYVIGGLSTLGISPLADVWKSSDGVNWNAATTNTGFVARSVHTSVVLNGDIYVIGGSSGSLTGSLNDVWRSSDGGTNWTQIPVINNFPARNRHTSVVLNGDIYVIGGVIPNSASSGGTDATTNDVWRSSDGGTNWTQIPVIDNFPVRRDHTSVVLNNNIYLIGGRNASSGRLNDVWRSTDGGANWIEVTAAANFPVRDSFGLVVLDGDMYVIAGSYNRSDMWKSTDGGANWIEVTTITQFPGGDLSAVVFGGEIYMIGGLNDVVGARESDVWVFR